MEVDKNVKKLRSCDSERFAEILRGGSLWERHIWFETHQLKLLKDRSVNALQSAGDGTLEFGEISTTQADFKLTCIE